MGFAKVLVQRVMRLTVSLGLYFAVGSFFTS